MYWRIARLCIDDCCVMCINRVLMKTRSKMLKCCYMSQHFISTLYLALPKKRLKRFIWRHGRKVLQKLLCHSSAKLVGDKTYLDERHEFYVLAITGRALIRHTCLLNSPPYSAENPCSLHYLNGIALIEF